MVAVSNEPGDETIGAVKRARQADRVAEAKEDPLVQAILKEFPEAEIVEVRDTPSDRDPTDDADDADDPA